MKKIINTVLFDLDGTLLDTAPDLAFAINKVLSNHGKPPIMFDKFRFHVHGGTQTMLMHGFGITQHDPSFNRIKEDFLKIYRNNLAKETTYFPHMENVLDYLEEYKIPWGIVTNKPGWLTKPLLDYFPKMQKAFCVVCGDTVARAKPYPDSLLHACHLQQKNPQQTVYIGDTATDMIAAKAAGMSALAVLHGYHPQESKPQQWVTDALIEHPREIIEWLKSKKHSFK